MEGLTLHAFHLTGLKAGEIIDLWEAIIHCSIVGANAEFLAALWVGFVKEVFAHFLVFVAR